MQTNLVKMVQFIVFAIIQLPLLPLAIIGYMFLVVKVLLYAKKHGISATSTNPLTSRWILHIFRLREDEDGTKMISSLPFISGVGLWLMMGPSYIAYRICGYRPSLAQIPEPEKASFMSFVNSRTEFFDKIMEKILIVWIRLYLWVQVLIHGHSSIVKGKILKSSNWIKRIPKT